MAGISAQQEGCAAGVLSRQGQRGNESGAGGVRSKAQRGDARLFGGIRATLKTTDSLRGLSLKQCLNICSWVQDGVVFCG
jgi:hypothetical protein